MSTPNIGFNEEISKIIIKLSSNMQLICSSESNLPMQRPAEDLKFGDLETVDILQSRQ